MSKKKTSEGDASVYAATWQDGYGAGSTEAFRWCIRKTMEFHQKTASADADLLVKMMTKELNKRYPPPPPKDGESVAPLST